MSGAPKRRRPRASPPPGRPRTGARLAAVQALFQSEQTGDPAEAVIEQFVRHRIGAVPGMGGFEEGRVPQADVPLFIAIVRAAAREGAALDQVVRESLVADWPLERIDPVLRALFRAAAAELRDPAGPPARVVINEYLDVAHGFLDAEGVRFANGVLDAMAKRLRPAEFAPAGPAPAGGKAE
ncbi:transcription antitermination factor NusB [Caldovatus aquaticus]|uniref:Transcription antitermination protein NusB n=1 Tax=Caldovatus aquaticus TaxID=2865671 RepID=A0ABS7EZL7_9PROT|nr:transcription antitermination factor NusB [Caldovatus aquaticus]MBW8268528.1 transcription antitermination factor NusB [Caldovatus aquaticus]